MASRHKSPACNEKTLYLQTWHRRFLPIQLGS
jgi:hypothetical protein